MEFISVFRIQTSFQCTIDEIKCNEIDDKSNQFQIFSNWDSLRKIVFFSIEKLSKKRNIFSCWRCNVKIEYYNCCRQEVIDMWEITVYIIQSSFLSSSLFLFLRLLIISSHRRNKFDSIPNRANGKFDTSMVCTHVQNDFGSSTFGIHLKLLLGTSNN